jgi:hypothetical protein
MGSVRCTVRAVAQGIGIIDCYIDIDDRARVVGITIQVIAYTDSESTEWYTVGVVGLSRVVGTIGAVAHTESGNEQGVGRWAGLRESIWLGRMDILEIHHPGRLVN